jgi:hypothetical protein
MQQYRVIVYAYHSEAASEIEHDIDTFAEQFAASLPKPKTAKQAPPLRPGAQIRVVPECDDLRFSPPFEVRRWFESWMRFDFRAEVKSHLVGETLFVRLSMQVAGIEIATIKLAVEVIEPSATGQSEPKLKNPLAAAKAKLSTVRMYNKIFISYSRKDSTVAHAYRLAQIAAGNDVFLDTESIRAGEDWQAALAHAIDDADILQLFWSEHSATSPNVRDEWDYALRHKCAADQCRTFIRPVYWVNPMPPPPPELAHLNFRFVPLRPIDVTGE